MCQPISDIEMESGEGARRTTFHRDINMFMFMDSFMNFRLAAHCVLFNLVNVLDSIYHAE